MQDKTRVFSLAAIAAAAFLVLAGPAFACSCAPPPDTPHEVMRRTPVLFWGRAVHMTEIQGERFYVVETWAGNAVSPATVTVRTRAQSAACGIELPLNQVELIGGTAKDGYVYANLCTKYWIDAHRPTITRLMKDCTPFAPCPAK